MQMSANESKPSVHGSVEAPEILEAVTHINSHSVFKVLGHAARDSQASVMVFDASGVCGWVNPGTKRLFDVEDATALVGRLSLWEHCSVPEDPEGEMLELAFRGESVDLPALDYHLQQLIPGAAGQADLRVSAKLLPLLDENGGVVAVYLFNRERVSDSGFQPTIEVNPERLQLLRAVAGAKGFARKTAHDFNNYIAVMQGFAAILQSRLQHDEQNKAMAQQIEASGTEALKLTGWLAAFASDAPMERFRVGLNQVVEQVLAQCQGKKPQEIELAVKLVDQLPMLMGSKEDLELLCRNLWQNAVEAMPQGGTLRWQTSLDRFPSEGTGNGDRQPFLRLQVSDSGVGMDPETRSRMFDPFFTTKQGKQRGLGLTKVYEIVCAHQGYVEVTTDLGEGTCVQVYLPAQLGLAGVHSDHQGSAEVQRSNKLLVVDDEEMLSQMLKEFLEGEGYDVSAAVSGEEAVALCQDPEVKIDAVILDMSLPGMTGQQTFQRLVELQSEIKVIISTGDPRQQAVHDVMGQGAHGMLSKPFSLDHLAKVVRQVLRLTMGGYRPVPSADSGLRSGQETRPAPLSAGVCDYCR